MKFTILKLNDSLLIGNARLKIAKIVFGGLKSMKTFATYRLYSTLTAVLDNKAGCRTNLITLEELSVLD